MVNTHRTATLAMDIDATERTKEKDPSVEVPGADGVATAFTADEETEREAEEAA